jgi:hypothetical protein
MKSRYQFRPLFSFAENGRAKYIEEIATYEIAILFMESSMALMYLK